MIATGLICVAAVSGCGSTPGADERSLPSVSPAETPSELRASYQSLAMELDSALCRFAAVAASSSSTVQALRRAASDMARTSNWFTNRLATMPWPESMWAHSQVLVKAIAAVEAELLRAADRTTGGGVAKHIHNAQRLIEHIPEAATRLRNDLHITNDSGCSGSAS
jgi:ABC-type phosphate/phosphonate transport system substrate-binding protein